MNFGKHFSHVMEYLFITGRRIVVGSAEALERNEYTGHQYGEQYGQTSSTEHNSGNFLHWFKINDKKALLLPGKGTINRQLTKQLHERKTLLKKLTSTYSNGHLFR